MSIGHRDRLAPVPGAISGLPDGPIAGCRQERPAQRHSPSVTWWRSFAYGTSATTVSGRPTRAASRDWRSGCTAASHQWLATYSGDTSDDTFLGRRPHVQVGDEWMDERPEGRLDDDERDAGERAAPILAQPRDLIGVLGDVHRTDVLRQGPPELDRLDDRSRQARHRDDDPVALPRRLEDLP